MPQGVFQIISATFILKCLSSRINMFSFRPLYVLNVLQLISLLLRRTRIKLSKIQKGNDRIVDHYTFLFVDAYEL